MPDTDPNQVRLTGENSFIRLLEAADGPHLTRVSHWRILYSPAGAGHALFIESDVTDRAVRIYSDNEAMTRWRRPGGAASWPPAPAPRQLGVKKS